MDMQNFFLNRATVRKYTENKISDDVVCEMLSEAAHAPTTGNMQLYSVIITRSQKGK